MRQGRHVTTCSHMSEYLVKTLPLRNVKASLSAVVEAAERGEATTITKHGRPAAVVVPVEDARRLCGYRHRGDRQVAGARDPDTESTPFRSTRCRCAQSVRFGSARLNKLPPRAYRVARALCVIVPLNYPLEQGGSCSLRGRLARLGLAQSRRWRRGSPARAASGAACDWKRRGR